MIDNPKIFYDAYFHQQHLYTLLSYKTILDLSEEKDFFNKLDHSIREDHNLNKSKLQAILKRNIRFNYLHSIETLFELVFALYPSEEDRLFMDDDILHQLVSSPFQKNYEKIKRIANREESEIEQLQNKLTISNESNTTRSCELSLIRYIFYFVYCKAFLDIPPEIDKKIHESEAPILDLLITLANDFKDRGEYNAYKHAGRAFPGVSNISFQIPNAKQNRFDWDLSDSISFLERKKDGSLTFRTRVQDTERDVKMTILCSKLIENIISIRRDFYNNKKSVKINFFTKEGVQNSSKINLKSITEFKIRIKPL